MEPLWDFALRVYGRPNVSAACLRLQERCGADVPMLLFAAWLGAGGRMLAQDRMAAFDARIAPWRDEVVRPLRAVRQRMKTGPAPAPDAATEALRTKVKAAELGAERIELDLLETLAMQDMDSLPRAADAVARNLETALAHYGGRPDADARAALAILAGAVG
ncbi:TIGR02444 family protein [Halovulum dunhuangense]|nr:TIGR02444 family protein [Halovulum dunhuangense]